MYYSVYFIRGYATHGYHPVPMHEAASHGCVRNPIPDLDLHLQLDRSRGCDPCVRLAASRSARRPSAGRGAVAAQDPPDADSGIARETLLAELREHALVIGEVTLSSGQTAQYYVDAKRALLRPAGFRAAGELIAAEAAERGATAVGGMTMGADPLACAAIARRGRRRPGRLLRPQGAQGARPAALGRGARARARNPLPGRRGRGDHRRLDRRGDRADPRGGPRGRRGRPRRRPARRRRRGDRGGRRGALPRRWSRSTSSIRTAPTGSMRADARQGDDAGRSGSPRSGACLLAIVMTWPLLLHLGDIVPRDIGDPLAEAWQPAWGGHALLHQPLHFFDANRFWPIKDSLAFGDALIGYAPGGNHRQRAARRHGPVRPALPLRLRARVLRRLPARPRARPRARPAP